MTLYFRLIYSLFRYLFTPGKIGYFDTIERTFRVWPTDIDFNMHMNNAIYLSLCDFLRVEYIFRSGVLAPYRAKNAFFFGATHFVRYRRQLKLWQKFNVQTRFVGISDDGFYLETKFISNDFVHAVVLSKACGFSPGKGLVKPSELMNALGLDPEQVPQLPEYAKPIIEADQVLKDIEKGRI